MQSVKIPSKSEYYDALPYDSYSFPYSHPARLSAVARLFGLTPPTNKKFRVLELGAASGGNLIPLAMFYPEVELVGIDYSTVQVEKAKKLINSLGLDNRVQFLCQSITELDHEELGLFDYIICHGVYSWVPNEVQDAIISGIKKHLKADGIAYVSYNVYPGWKRLEVLRDMMLYHTRLMTEHSAQERLAQGRAIVEFIKGLSHENSAVRQMIDRPWEDFKNKSDSYLGHELLEPVNQPCYFLDFAEKLASYNLSYLADAEPSLCVIHDLPQEKITELIQASQNNQIMLEQYMDFLYFRQFRKSLIVHQEAGDTIKRQIPNEVFDKLNYSIDFCLEEATQEGNPSVIESTTVYAGNVAVENNSETPTLKPAEHRFILSHNRPVTTYNEADYAVMKSLAELTPQVFNKQQVLKKASEIHKDPQLSLNITNIFSRLSLTGLSHIWDQLPSETPIWEIEKYPYIPEIMRHYYRETGHLSNYLHNSIGLTIIQHQIIDLMDGEHSIEDMLNHLKKALEQGIINLLDNNNQALPDEHIDAALTSHLEQALHSFKANSLLYKKHV
ncbi:MAG: class I SAM-dependent methyltransferase [Alcaligenaceae bacterium]|nr:class I SAM-dependent methyltransferase [Alcaligenaceae bacterium]